MADASAAATPQLIPTVSSTVPAAAFPSTTSDGTQNAPATGTQAQLIPTVGSTNPNANPNTTGVPGATSPGPASSSGSNAGGSGSGARAANGYSIPGATQAPTSSQATIAPTNPDALTSKQLNELLSSGSPYVDLAKSQAQQASAARGLQNSTLAAQSGEAAAISAAEPIAAADAQAVQAQQQQNLTAVNQFGQQQQQTQLQEEATAKQIAEQTGGTLATQAQQGQINTQLQAQSEQAAINQIIAQGNVNAQLQASGAAFTALQSQLSNNEAIELSNANLQNQLKLTFAQSEAQINQINAQAADTVTQINAQAAANASQDGPALQSQYLTGISTIMQTSNQQIAAVYSTQGLSAQQQQDAVATIKSQMQEEIANLGAYYASSPLWDTGQNPAPIPGASSATTPINPQAVQTAPVQPAITSTGSKSSTQAPNRPAIPFR